MKESPFYIARFVPPAVCKKESYIFFLLFAVCVCTVECDVSNVNIPACLKIGSVLTD